MVNPLIPLILFASCLAGEEKTLVNTNIPNGVSLQSIEPGYSGSWDHHAVNLPLGNETVAHCRLFWGFTSVLDSIILNARVVWMPGSCKGTPFGIRVHLRFEDGTQASLQLTPVFPRGGGEGAQWSGGSRWSTLLASPNGENLSAEKAKRLMLTMSKSITGIELIPGLKEHVVTSAATTPDQGAVAQQQWEAERQMELLAAQRRRESAAAELANRDQQQESAQAKTLRESDEIAQKQDRIASAHAEAERRRQNRLRSEQDEESSKAREKFDAAESQRQRKAENDRRSRADQQQAQDDWARLTKEIRDRSLADQTALRKSTSDLYAHEADAKRQKNDSAKNTREHGRSDQALRQDAEKQRNDEQRQRQIEAERQAEVDRQRQAAARQREEDAARRAAEARAKAEEAARLVRANILENAAKLRTEILASGYIEHGTSNGVTLFIRKDKSGVNFKAVNENEYSCRVVISQVTGEWTDKKIRVNDLPITYLKPGSANNPGIEGRYHQSDNYSDLVSYTFKSWSVEKQK